MTVVRCGDIPVEVEQVGSGPPVLFVHGVYVNGHVWDAVVGELASTHTCWVPTLPLGGHASPVGLPALTLERIAGLIPELLAALDLRDVTLVGSDTGGGLVLLALGSGHPEMARAARIVLTNCDSYDHFPPKSFRPLIVLARRAPFVAKRILRSLLTTEKGRRKFLRSVTRRDDAGPVFGGPDVLDDAVRVTAALTPSERTRTMGWLPGVAEPVSLVWGDQCPFFPVADAQRLEAALPHATLTVVPGARTFVQLDEPHAVAQAVRGPAGTPARTTHEEDA